MWRTSNGLGSAVREVVLVQVVRGRLSEEEKHERRLTIGKTETNLSTMWVLEIRLKLSGLCSYQCVMVTVLLLRKDTMTTTTTFIRRHLIGAGLQSEVSSRIIMAGGMAGVRADTELQKLRALHLGVLAARRQRYSPGLNICTRSDTHPPRRHFLTVPLLMGLGGHFH